METYNKKACVLTFYPGAGIGSMARCLLALLKEIGYDADVYYFDKVWRCIKENSVEWGGIKYNKIPYFPILFIPMLNYLLPSLFLNKLIRGYGLLISISGSFHVSLPYVVQGRNHITKVATTYYEEQRSKLDFKNFQVKYCILAIELLLFRWANEWVEKMLYKSRYNKAVLVDSYCSKSTLTKRFGARENVSIFPYCVDVNIFKPRTGETNNKSGSNQEDYYIFSCARFDDGRKNLPLLLNAFKLLKQNNDLKKLKLIIAGFKPLRPARFYAKTGLDDSTVFLGNISEEEKVSYYQEASVFVLPSRQEGLGIVILEAMACGVPVISTKCGGPETIIEDGVNGIFTKMDEEAMAADIERLLKNKLLAENLVENGLKTIREGFSKKNALSVLKEAISKK